jgi:hypothetical protein
VSKTNLLGKAFKVAPFLIVSSPLSGRAILTLYLVAPEEVLQLMTELSLALAEHSTAMFVGFGGTEAVDGDWAELPPPTRLIVSLLVCVGVLPPGPSQYIPWK